MPTPLRVILDDRCLRRTLTGVGNYVAQLLRHLPPDGDVRIDPFVRTHLPRFAGGSETAPPPAKPAKTGGAHHPADVGGGRKPWWMRRLIQGTYASVFRFKTRGRYDLYHEPNHVPMRTRLPTVTTIHDLSVVVHPEWHPADRVRWYEAAFEAGLRRTRRILAASEFTRREIVERLGFDAERIDVTYQGPRDAFVPQSAEQIAGARAALGVPERFFLYVGTLEPRKNVNGLLGAYAALPLALRAEHPLLIAGAWGWKADALRRKLAEHRFRDTVRLLGFMQDEQLAALYSACTALVWPTFYEGFGLPPLEAMACGAPVIVSDVASLPEVVGQAGLRLPPADRDAWAAAMQRVADDTELVERMRAASREQAGRFSWPRCVADTCRSYRAAVEG